MPVSLRSAAANIHNDPRWLRKLLIGGALALTVVGLPWPAGMVVESMDNTRRGFATPLPPWYDWGTRYVVGFLALLIDLLFFVLPALLIGMLLFCSAVLLTVGGGLAFGPLPLLAGGLLLALELLMFGLGAAPLGRLIYVVEGSLDRALGAAPLRLALHPGARGAFGAARLRSLPAYLPAALLGLACWWAAGASFPASWLLALLLLWLALSALLYAHLVVAQLYCQAARSGALPGR